MVVRSRAGSGGKTQRVCCAQTIRRYYQSAQKIDSDLSDRVLSDVQTGIGKTRTLLYWSSRQANHEDFFNFKENDWFHFSYKDRWQLQYLAQHHAVSL